MDELDADVIICGAGPTGLMLAGELRLAGVSVIVVDRLGTPIKESRALGFSARTIEEFDQRGLLPQFGELQTIPIGHFGGFPIDFRIQEGGSYGARGIPQSVTEAVLARWATGLGTQLRRHHEVTGLTMTGDGVSVELLTPAGSSRLRARYLAGCDGARSFVRKAAGIEFPGTEPVIEMRLADVAGCRLRPRFSGERVPGGMVMVLPLGPDVSRVVVYERDAGLSASREAPSFADVAAAWERLTGEDIHGGTPLWTSSFTDASHLASTYRRDRVFLAGDAAHVHLPIGGQGMSAGVQDAVNLGWKLAGELHGHAPVGLLDSYSSERRPAGAGVLTNTLAQRILYLGGPEVEPLRELMAGLMAFPDVQRHLVGMVTGLDLRYDVGPGDHPLLGRRIPRQELVSERGQGGRIATFELLHAARGILLDLAGDPAVRTAAAPWADRVEVVCATPLAPGGPLEAGERLLVRPDGYVAWAAASQSPTAGLRSALARWFGEARLPS